MTSAIEEYYKLKMRLDEPIKADDVDFEPFKRVIRGDRERLEKRRCILLQELENDFLIDSIGFKKIHRTTKLEANRLYVICIYIMVYNIGWGGV